MNKFFKIIGPLGLIATAVVLIKVKTGKSPIKNGGAKIRIVEPYQIINELNDKYDIKIRSVQQLNKILESLGLIVKIGFDWWQTDRGMQFVSSKSKFCRANRWSSSIVDYIANNLKEFKT